MKHVKDIKSAVRMGYGKIAKEGSTCCGPVTSCCGNADTAVEISKAIGYTDKDMASIPEGANLGLGCGNPIALASLKEGETVLDLGSGAGFDCFLAANRVGASGKVIGVDMTPEMLERARGNAAKGGYMNVEFRLGEIEHLPVADNSVDIVISNCVINLSPDKRQVFKEVFRVLKPGGRLMVSDIVLNRELPAFLKDSADAYVGCVSGAVLKDEYLKMVVAAGFADARIIEETRFPVNLSGDPAVKDIISNLKVSEDEIRGALRAVTSIKVEGVKP